MFFNPSIVLFLMCLLRRILITTSSPSLLFRWVALELNTLRFIPLILNNNNKKSRESSVKYFLTQAFASILFLLGISVEINETVSQFLILVAILIKLGAAPFHAWLPGLVESLNWKTFLILITVQKINPLIILTTPLYFNSFYTVAIWASLVVGAIIGLAQTQIRSILMYSSINHIGWLLVAWVDSNYNLAIYFTSYCLLLTPVVIFLDKINCNQLNQLSNLTLTLPIQFLIFSLLLSLGGLPPFFGFLPKWLILQEALISEEVDLEDCFLIVAIRLITLFFYLRITFSAFLLSNLKWNQFLTKLEVKLDRNKVLIMLSSLSIVGLSLSFVII